MGFYFFDPSGTIPPVMSIGSKGYNLCRMAQAGLNVPPFFVITADTVAQWKKHGTRLGAQDLPELYAAIDRLGGKDDLVSVRSSASIEDGTSFSFAGQFYTGLFVDKKGLEGEILKCIESASAANIAAYMRLNKIVAPDFPFAIVVQKMVAATRSGIGFSMRPGGNLAAMCIVSGYGAGEGVVLEKVETDTYLVNRRNRELQKTIANKTEQFAFDGVPRLLSVDREKRELPALSDNEIQAVGDLLLKTEKLLGTPSDIEFCMDEKGELFLLQMRPITSIQPENIKILDNTNIIESYPGISLPLTFDFAREAYAKLFRSSARAFWVSKRDITRLEEVFQHLIAHVEGRIYYRLDNWYRMLALVHGSRRSMRDWENAVGLRDSEMDQVIQSLRGKMRSYVSSFWLILTFRRGNKIFYQNFSNHYEKLRNFESFGDDVSKLWQHYETHTSSLFAFWYHTIVNDFLAFQSFGWAQALLGKANVPELANDLVASKSGVASEEAIVEVLRLKDLILNNGELRSLFEKEDMEILVALKEGKSPDFAERFFSYLDRYGDRTLAELKLETPSPRRSPVLLVRMLKQQRHSQVKAEDFLHKKTLIYKEAIHKKNQHFFWLSLKRVALEGCLRLARYGLKNRENMRFCRTRAYGAVKDIFLEIGRKMTNEGRMIHENDIFYLHLDEVKAYCLKKEGDDFRDTIAQRKSLLLKAETLQLPDRIMYTDTLPDFAQTFIEQNGSGDELLGIGVSPGTITADALVVTHPGYDMEVKNRVLVSKMTDPGWVFLMAQSGALVSEKGSLLSHTAIVGRELGIPVVVNIPGATQRIHSGDVITVNGTKGTVRIEKRNTL